MGGGKVSEGKREKELEESGTIDSDRKSPKMPSEYQAITTTCYQTPGNDGSAGGCVSA